MKLHARFLMSFMAVLAMVAFVTVGCSDTTDPTDPNADVTLAAPPAGQGIQVAIGPIDIPSGTEVQRNYFQKIQSDTDIYITKIEFRFNPGSHHLNIFKNDSTVFDDHMEETFNAIDFKQWEMVAASQKGNFTWELPPGVAIKLKAHQQMIFQTHYVNGLTQSTPTGRGKVLVNFWTTPKENVTSLVGAIFSNNKAVTIPAHTAATFCKVVKPISQDINILLMTGHFHSRGKNFYVGHWDGTKLTDTIYHSSNWDEPPITSFNPAIHLNSLDSIAYITTYENRSNLEIKFGGHVETEEHSNLFTFYYPILPDGKAVYDFNGGIEMLSERRTLP